MSGADEDSSGLARAWLAAARAGEVSAALERVYTSVASEITERGPACWASGRCCNFAKSGHLLYVTGLEAAYAVTRLAGQGRGDLQSTPARTITLKQVGAARARGDCPFLEGNLCGIHAIKPLGCRVYFCDRSAQEWQRDLSERALGEIKRIHDEYGVAYRYGEWRGMLEIVACVGLCCDE